MEAIYTVKLDTDESVSSAKDLGKTITQLNSEMEELEKNGNGNTEQFKELEKAVESLSKEEKKLLGDMEHLGQTIKVEVSGSISKMEDRLYELVLAEQESSKEFIELRDKTAAYKKIIVETDRAIDGLVDNGTNLSGALALGEGVAAGFQAYTGVTVLLGDENEALIETITKLQAAQGLLSSVQSIRLLISENEVRLSKAKVKATILLANAQKFLSGGIKFQTVATKGAAVAQRILNIAMNANPIGLLIAGITALIALFVIFSGTAKDNKKAQESLADSIDETNDSLDRQNKILDEINAAAQKRIDNTNKLIDGEIKYLQAIKNRTKTEEETLQKKLGEKQANEISKIELSIDTAQKKTKSFGKSFAQQFEAIDLAIKGTNIEDGVNDIDYSKVTGTVEKFKQELIAVLGSDIGAEEKVKQLQKLENSYDKTTTKLSGFNRKLGEAEKEEFQGVIDGFSEVGILIEKSRATLTEFNGLVQDRDNVVALNEQAAALEKLQDSQKKQEEQEKRRDRNRKIFADRRKKEQAEAQRIVSENIAFIQKTEDIRISLIENQTEKELALLDIKLERELAAITSQSEEANALRAEVFNRFVADEQAIQDRLDEKKKASAIALETELAEISRNLRLSETELELNNLQRKQSEELVKLREGLELGIVTQAEINELKILQQTEYQAKIDEIADASRAQQLAKDEEANAKKMAMLQQNLDFAGGVANGLTNLSKIVSETQINNAEGNEARQEQIRRKSFDRNKKLQIASATIAGIQGVINALTAPSLVPEPFGSILKGINAGIVGGITLANIAKIKSTSYSGGGGRPTTGSSGSGAGAAAAQLGARNLTDIRTSLNGDGTTTDGGDGAGSTPELLVNVLESDISNTQATVEKARVRSTY